MEVFWVYSCPTPVPPLTALSLPASPSTLRLLVFLLSPSSPVAQPVLGLGHDESVRSQIIEGNEVSFLTANKCQYQRVMSFFASPFPGMLGFHLPGAAEGAFNWFISPVQGHHETKSCYYAGQGGFELTMFSLNLPSGRVAGMCNQLYLVA